MRKLRDCQFGILKEYLHFIETNKNHLYILNFIETSDWKKVSYDKCLKEDESYLPKIEGKLMPFSIMWIEFNELVGFSVLHRNLKFDVCVKRDQYFLNLRKEKINKLNGVKNAAL